MSETRGRFITIEGVEGAGKSTHVEAVRALLEASGRQVVTSREPGGTGIAERIRGLLLDPGNRGMSHETETLLIFAARADHVARVIEPALSRGKWVICDRFTDATYAYQGGGRRIDEGRLSILEDWVQGSLRPDLTLILDLDVGQGLERAGKRSDRDRFEREQLDFFERVREGYLARAKSFPDRCRVIDASRTLDEVRDDILSGVRGLI